MESNKDSTEFIQSSNLVEKKIGHNKLQTEIENLSKTLAEKEKALSECQSQITQLHQKCSSLEGLNIQLNNEKKSLADELQATKATLQNSVSSDVLKESTDKISSLQSTNTQVTEELNSIQNLYDNTQKQLAEALGLIEELKISNTNLGLNFDQLSAEYAVSAEQSSALKSEINALQNNIDSQLAEINSLKDQISHSKGVTLELNTIIEEKTKEIELLSSSSAPVIAEGNNVVIKGKSVRASKNSRR